MSMYVQNHILGCGNISKISQTKRSIVFVNGAAMDEAQLTQKSLSNQLSVAQHNKIIWLNITCYEI